MSRRVCFLTTVHPVFDVRIFYKEIRTLDRAGYDVALIGQHSKNEIVEGITIIALPKTYNRFFRIFGTTLKVFILALKQKADVYHFHDPELIPIGLLLKILGKKVIYDVHEDYEQKILSKYWIRKAFRKPISFFIGTLEKISSIFFDYIVTADSHIKMKFKSCKVEVIANFPPLNFASGSMAYKKEDIFKIIYVGGISEDRGIFKMLKAMEYLKHKEIELHLLGNVDDQNLLSLFESTERVKYHGFLPWREVSKYLVNANVGLLLLQPLPAYFYYPGENVVKLFEYMSVGLPIIISDFPKLKNIISEIGSGICVDPTDPKKIADAIKFLYQNSDLRRQMGENGRKAVLEKYNWENESKRLLGIYEELYTK